MARRMARKDIRLFLIILTILVVMIPVIRAVTSTGYFSAVPVIEEYPNNNNNRTLRVVANKGTEPYIYVGKNGEPSGYDVEILYKVANRLGYNVDLRFVNWENVKPMIMNKEADIIIGKSVSYNDRNSGLLLSIPTVRDMVYLYGKKELLTVPDLYGKKVGLLKGSVYKSDLQMETMCTVVEYDSYEEAFLDCQQDKVEYVVCRNLVGRSLVNSLSLTLAPCFAFFESYTGFATNQGNILLMEDINHTLAELQNEGVLREMHNKWLSRYEKYVDVWEDMAENTELYAFFMILWVVWVFVLMFYREMTKHNDRDKEFQSQLSRYHSILLVLTSEYDIIYTLHLVGGTMRPYLLSEEKEKLYRNVINTGNYEVILKELISRGVAENAREELYNLLKLENLREKMKNTNSFEREFLNIEGKYSEIKCIRFEDNKNLVVIASGERDAQIRAERARQIELTEARKEAENANKAKSTFLFNMSHDIRTPMNAIRGYTDVALKHIDDRERVRGCLNKIDTAGTHLLSLINDVLDMSRIETGNIAIEEKPVNILDELGRVIDICRDSAEKKRVELSFMAKHIRDLRVYTDSLHTNQILMNVLSNAIKYTNEGGKVIVTIEEIGKKNGIVKYEYTIQDNGIGMSEEFVSKIFENFTREKNTTMSGVEGTGLGMAIVKRLVDLLEGTIDIKSKKGVGTTVKVRLPMRLEESSSDFEMPIEVERKAISLEGRRALLVEDNEMNREIARIILEEKNIAVEEAVDGDDAVRKLSEVGAGYFDFILMDVQMPRMNGYEATRIIRKMRDDAIASIPIIAMTANAFSEDKREALKAGMNAHLAKPINIEELFKTLEEVL